MTSLFSAIDEAARAKTLLVASDFDGTLSQLVDSPNEATLHPRAEAAIRLLCECPDTHVMVVSGRALTELQSRFAALSRVELIGSHGNERVVAAAGGNSAERYARLAAVLRGIAAHADGAWIESKPLSLVIHFRAVPAEQRDDLLHMLSAFIPSTAADRTLIGRDTAEYLLAGEDKGSALRAAIQERSPDRVWFAGDDATDESAFQALRGGDIGLKVGPEPSIAHYRVATLEEAIDAFERLARQRYARTR